MIWDKNWGWFSNLFNFSLLSAWNSYVFHLRSEPWNPNLGPGFFGWRCRCSPSVSGMIPTFLVLLIPFEVCGAVWTHQIHQSQKVFGAGHIPMVCTCLYWFQASATKALVFGPWSQLSTDIPIYLAEMVTCPRKITCYRWFSWFPMIKSGDFLSDVPAKKMLEPRLGPLGWLHSARGDFRWTHRRPRTDGCFSQGAESRRRTVNVEVQWLQPLRQTQLWIYVIC
jgi:hypothetical protein